MARNDEVERMEDNRPAMYQTGEAVFLKWQDCMTNEADNLWELSQQTKQKLLQGETPTRYVATDVLDFYPGVVNAILVGDDLLTQYLQAITGDLDDEMDGVLSCAVFWDMHQGEGVLIHRRGAQWLVAMLPAVDRKAAEREAQVARELSALSARTQGIPVRLDQAIGQGRHTLSHVLDVLSEQINV